MDTSSSGSDEGMDYQPAGVKLNISKSVALFIGKMRADPTISRKAITRCTLLFDDIMKDIICDIKSGVSNFLQQTNLLDVHGTQLLLKQLNFASPFNGYRSKEGQISASNSNFHYLQPETLFLRDRVDQIHVGMSQYRQRPVHETAEYVSITNICKLVARKDSIWNFMQNHKPSTGGELSCFTDGDYFAEHPFFSKYPTAFQILLYYDDVEVTNAEGSKCGIHKLGCFYVIILNVPPHLNSLLASIHVLVVANQDDIATLGFRPFLQPFLDEMKKLESNEGVQWICNGVERTIRACLVGVIGDNKGVHELLGFLPQSARHFCRWCMISRYDLHKGLVVVGEPRTWETHAEHLAAVAENPEASTLYGVKEDTCLHDSRYFHVTRNKFPDTMHNDAEGWISMEIRLVLKQLICVDKYFTAADLNRRIRAFNYGITDVKNKPTANICEKSLNNAETAHKLKQTASQVLCLLRALPFLLDNIGVPDGNPYIAFLVLMAELTEYLLAPRLSRSALPYIGELIADHRNGYLALFPYVPRINKHHYVEHYVECIKRNGSLRSFWSMRPEGKHRPVKRHISSCGNYINPAKTGVQNAQIAQALLWGTDGPDVGTKVELLTVKKECRVDSLNSREEFYAGGFDSLDVVTLCNCVSVNGMEYNVGQYIVTRSAADSTDSMLSYGYIQAVICIYDESEVWLELQERDTIGYAEHLNANVISISPQAPIYLSDAAELPLHVPLSPWRDYSTNNTYLSLKHFVL